MNTSLAQIHNPVLPNTIGNDMSATGGIAAIGLWISSIVSIFLVITSCFALVFLVVSGFNWAVSEGDKAKLEKARNGITHAVIGLVIVAAAWAVWLLVGKFLGINFDNMPFPTLNQTT